MRLVAKSSRIGSPSGIGMPTQNGLVTKRASRPPKGATTGREITLTKWIETYPAATHCSAQWPMRPMWWLLASPTTATPCSAARSMPSRMASKAITCP